MILTKISQCEFIYQQGKCVNLHVGNKEGLYLTTGKLPVKYIITSRRLLYYWHLRNIDENELISRVLNAQVYKPEKNDW